MSFHVTIIEKKDEIRLVLDYGKEQEYYSSKNFYGFEKGEESYYYRLIKSGILENGLEYKVTDNMIRILQERKNKYVYDRILNKLMYQNPITMDRVLCNNTVLYDKSNGDEFNCDFIEETENNLVVYDDILDYQVFLKIGDELIQGDYLYEYLPFCVDIVDKKECFLLDQNYVYINMNTRHLQKDKCYIVTRYYLERLGYPSSLNVESIISIYTMVEVLCNGKNIMNGEESLINIRKSICSHFYKKMNSGLLSMKEELIQKIYEPKRVMYMLETYNYDIGLDEYNI